MQLSENYLSRIIKECILPELDKAGKIIQNIEYTDDNNSAITRYWWYAFCTNSKMLGFLIYEPRSYYQFAMTMRLLLEISVDLSFISKNRGNIQRLNEAQQKIANKQNETYTHRKGAKDAKNKFQLYSDTTKKHVNTRDRIRSAEDSERLLGLYDWLSGKNHFNHMHMIWEGNKNSKNNPTYNALEEHADLLVEYPLFFNMTVKAIGEITRDKFLLEYDNSKMENVLSKPNGHL